MEIPDTCEFEVTADQLKLTTQTNGDQINIRGIHLDGPNSAALAFMINTTSNHLKVEIKEV